MTKERKEKINDMGKWHWHLDLKKLYIDSKHK
jgi:hypothetical protein